VEEGDDFAGSENFLYEISDGVLNVGTGGSQYLYDHYYFPTNNTFKAKNFVIKFDFQVKDTGDYEEGYQGFIIHATEGFKMYYSFNLSYIDGWEVLLRGRGKTLIDQGEEGISQRAGTVKIVVYNQTYAIYLDGTPLSVFQTLDFGEGNYFSIEKYDSVLIDNLKFWDLDRVDF
jgi:hypothetical protein